MLDDWLTRAVGGLPINVALLLAGALRGATVLAITNIMGSQATREADGVLYTRAGLEIGVAATKTFSKTVMPLNGWGI